MIKCPFCQYDNEEGALFCEQCKSDLGVLEATEVAPAAVPTQQEEAMEPPVAEMMESVPMAHPVDLRNLDRVTAAKIPVARPLITSSETESEAAEQPTALVSEPGAQFSSGPSETVDSLKTFVPPSAGRTHSVDQPARESTDPPVTRDTDLLPTGSKPRLLVLRGQKINVEYPLYDGDNYIGRADEKPVDIDLEDQEPPDRIWSSRQHALIHFDGGVLVIEDLNSSNGTFVNRTRLYPGQKRVLNVNDVIQIGTVQMKVVMQ
jgi:hypothetical protein